MQRHYQLELSSLWTGGLSWRRLGVLVRNLPPESAAKTAIRNAMPVTELSAAAVEAEYGAWSQTDMLLAELIDVARWLQWAKTPAAEKGVGQPKPFPRPGVDRPGQVSAKVISLLDYVRDHQGAAPTGYTEG